MPDCQLREEHVLLLDISLPHIGCCYRLAIDQDLSCQVQIVLTSYLSRQGVEQSCLARPRGTHDSQQPAVRHGGWVH